MFSYRHIIFFICIFSIFNYSFYYYFKNLPSLTKLISFDKASFEFINNRTIVIYHAYLIQLTTKKFPKGKWHIRMTAFANKNFKNITNDEGIFVEILNGPKIPAAMFEISESYGDIEFVGKCWWGTWFIDAVIPDMDLKKIDEKIKITFDDREVVLPIQKVTKRNLGLSVCVQTLYWFVDFPKIVEFIETWKILGTTHFYFYYQSVTKEVFAVLREYEKLGIVTIVKTDFMPKTDHFDPNKALYQMGHTAIYNDCLMRTKTKFMALVDVDEIILPQHNQTLLAWLETEAKNDPNVGSFIFKHAALHFDGSKMKHLNTKWNKFITRTSQHDWRSINFSWITTPKYFPLDRPPKPIEITDGIIIILTHKVDSHQWPYHEKNVTYDEAVYYRTTNNYTSLKGTQIDNNSNISLFNERLKIFFNEDLRIQIQQHYTKIMETIAKTFEPKFQYEVMDILQKCLKSWKINVCSPTYHCHKYLHNVTDWIYANSSSKNSEYFIL